MTYRELFYKATRLIDKGDITLGEYDEMTKPLDREIEQEPKAGHWECNELFYDGESRGAIITCSKCGNKFKVSPKVFENLYDNERFCNHCGARMMPQESEEQDADSD